MPKPWARGARVRIRGLISGEEYVNVLHFATNSVVSDGPPFEVLLKQLANAVFECVTDTLIPAVAANWSIADVDVQAIYPDLTDPLSADAVTPTGGELGDQGIGFAAQLVSVTTGGGGRSGRGRIFLPPGPEVNATDGEWTAPQLALVAAFCACMATKFIGASSTTPWKFGVLSRKKTGDPPTQVSFDDGFREALALTPKKIIARMGSRQKGKGS